MTRPACFLIPGDISLPTGGYGYDRKVLAEAAAAGFALRHVALPGGFPFPSPEVLTESARLIAALPADAVLLIDGLAYGALPADMIRAFGRPVVELCHHPLALEPGHDAATVARLTANERAAMALAQHVIVTGGHTAGLVTRDFGVPRDKITVALPGTERATRATGSGRAVPHLIAVGSVIPRKAYDVLVTAMAQLAHLDWTLDIIGATQHAPDTLAQITALIAEHHLGARIRLAGAMTSAALDNAFDGADLFVMSSLYEGYGMVIAEAMARGLPIVGTTGGAAGDTLDDSAGLKVPPGDSNALADAIAVMLENPERRAAFADGSWAAGHALPTWAETARTIISVLKEQGA